MENLHQDVQILIISFLKPEELIKMYNSFPKIIDDLLLYRQISIQCTAIVSEETIEWFQQHKIQLLLLDVCDSYDYVLEKFGEGVLARTKKNGAHFIQKGQLIEQENHLRVTQQGKFFLDGIAADFFEV